MPDDEKRMADLDVRLDAAEKQAFKDAAEYAGVSLSEWVRVRLRRAAARELKRAGLSVEFLDE